MWTLDESLHGGFMILLGFIVIILARKIAAIFRKDDIDLTKMNDIHSWSELDALLKVRNTLYVTSHLEILIFSTSSFLDVHLLRL